AAGRYEQATGPDPAALLRRLAQGFDPGPAYNRSAGVQVDIIPPQRHQPRHAQPCPAIEQEHGHVRFTRGLHGRELLDFVASERVRCLLDHVTLYILDAIQRICAYHAFAESVIPDATHHGEDIVDCLRAETPLQQLRLEQLQIRLGDVRYPALAELLDQVLGFAPVHPGRAGRFLRIDHLEPALHASLNGAPCQRTAVAREQRRSGRARKVRRIVEATFLDLGHNRPALVVRIGDAGLVDLDDAGQGLAATLAVQHEADAQLFAVNFDPCRHLVIHGFPPIQAVIAVRL